MKHIGKALAKLSKKNKQLSTTNNSSWGETHERSVAIFLDKTAAKPIIRYWYLSNRIAIVKIRVKPFDFAIIQVYAPTADKQTKRFTNSMNN